MGGGNDWIVLTQLMLNRATKELEVLQRTLLKNNPAVPMTGSVDERKQLDAWRKYIEWEKANTLRIEDKLLLTKRVIFAYEQCLLVMGHHPELWYEAAQFLVRMSRDLTDAGDMIGGKKLGIYRIISKKLNKVKRRRCRRSLSSGHLNPDETESAYSLCICQFRRGPRQV